MYTKWMKKNPTIYCFNNSEYSQHIVEGYAFVLAKFRQKKRDTFSQQEFVI